MEDEVTEEDFAVLDKTLKQIRHHAKKHCHKKKKYNKKKLLYSKSFYDEPYIDKLCKKYGIGLYGDIGDWNYFEVKEKKKKRNKELLAFKKKYGFDQRENWNFDFMYPLIMYPRFMYYVKNNIGWCAGQYETYEEYQAGVLKPIQKAFELHILLHFLDDLLEDICGIPMCSEKWDTINKAVYKKIEDGYIIFAKNIHGLWN